MAEVRIQKAIADSGYCSRRKAEELIRAGKVQVNGHPAEIGMKVEPARSIITVNGERIPYQRNRHHLYLMLYKPRGYVTTLHDDQGRRCISDLIAGLPERVYPVGRLDVNSEGLLLLTNDGGFANDLMHPSRHVTKTYRVTVRPDITDEQLIAFAEGIVIDGKKTLPADVRVVAKEPGRVVMELIIREGRNRQIRKMCEALGLEVARLKRTAIGPLRLGMLKPGKYRELSAEELRAIRTAIQKPVKS